MCSLYVYTYLYIYDICIYICNACIIAYMYTCMNTYAIMHAYTCICMQTKPRCMNAHMRAFMYVATLCAWLCVCMLGRMHTVQSTYIYKGKYSTQPHIPQGGGGSPGGPSPWGGGTLAPRMYIYIYIYIHTYT